MSADNFDFGLSDVLQEGDSGHTLARGGAAFLTVLFLILSSITTYLFFSTYAADIGAWAGPTAAPMVSGLIGVLCLDVACLVWSYVRSRASTSAAQMAIALVISVVDLLLALASSALFILLSTSLETGVRNAGGSLTQFGATVNWFGVGVITAALVGNFACVFAWAMTGADTQAAQQRTELRATVTAGQHTIDKERTGQIVRATIAEIRRQLPAAVDDVAARKSAEYVAGKLARGGRTPAGSKDAAEGVSLDDLVNLLAEERVRELTAAAQPAHAYGNGHGPEADARPTQRPPGR